MHRGGGAPLTFADVLAMLWSGDAERLGVELGFRAASSSVQRYSLNLIMKTSLEASALGGEGAA